MQDKIEFTPALFKQLKVEYATAKEAGKESFVFQGREVLVGYAKYLIEYLDGKFKS